MRPSYTDVRCHRSSLGLCWDTWGSGNGIVWYCDVIQRTQPTDELLSIAASYIPEGPTMTPRRCKCTTVLVREHVMLARCRTEGSEEQAGLGLTWMSLGSGSHHRPTRLSCDAWSSPWTVCCPKTPTWRPVGVCAQCATGLVLLYCCVQRADATIGRPIDQCDEFVIEIVVSVSDMWI